MSMRNKKLDMPYSQIDDVQEYTEAFDLETGEIDFNIIDEYKESPYALDASTLNNINDDVNIMQNNWHEDIDETLDDKAELFQSWIDNLGEDVRPWGGDVIVSGDIVTFEAEEDTVISDLQADINPIQDGTPWWSDKNTSPYLMRQSPQLDHVYSKEIDKLVGGTVAWNQLVQNGNFASTSNWTITRGTLSVSDNIGTYSITEIGSADNSNRIATYVSTLISGHKYLLSYDYKPKYSNQFRVTMATNGSSPTMEIATITGLTANAWNKINRIFASNGNTYNQLWIGIGANSNYVVGDTVQFANVMLIDLTALFGSAEIADYVYSLEQTTSGSGIAWLKSHGFLTKDYYAYNEGSLLSVKTSAHVTTGFNQWDEEWEVGKYNTNGEKANDTSRIRSKNKIPAIANTAYYAKWGDFAGDYGVVYFYDEDEKFISRTTPNASTHLFTTPINARYVTFYVSDIYGATYNNDICINISDSSKNGQYEPYEVHTYPLDSDLELRGKFKLDANNNLYAEGDVYPPSGQVERKWGYKVFDGSSDEGWVAYPSYNGYFIGIDDMKSGIRQDGIGNLPAVYWFGVGNQYLFFLDVYDTMGSTVEAFKTYLSSHNLEVVYPLATPTTEQADPYANPQVVSPLGTEEYVDTRDVPVPVGHETRYAEFYPISGWDEVNVTRSGFNALNPNADKIKGDYNLAVGAVLPSTSPTASTSGTNPISVVVGNAWDMVTFISDELIANNTYTADYIITGTTDNSKVRGTAYLIDDTYTVVEKIRNIQGSSGLKYTDVFTPSETGLKFALAVSSSPAQTLTIEDLCVHLGEGNYEPYQSNTYTIDLDGTRYGGTLDVTRGELTVDNVSSSMASLNWNYDSTGVRFICSNSFTNMKSVSAWNGIDIKCSLYPLGRTESDGSGGDKILGVYGSTIYIRDTSFTDGASLKQMLTEANAQLVYELATPITVQLTPIEVSALLGTNNVWADSGDVSVTYGANLSYYKNDVVIYSEDVGAMFLCLQDCDGLQPLPTALTVVNDYWLRVYDKGKTGLNVYNLTYRGRFNWQNNYVVNDVVWMDERHINFYVCINNVSYTINNTPNYDSAHWVKLFSVYRDGMPVYWEIPNQSFFNDIYSPSIFGVAQGTSLNFDSIDVLNNITNITEEDSSLRLSENEIILLTIYKQDGNAYSNIPMLHCGTLINVPLIESGVIYKIPLNFLFYNMHMGLLCIYEEGVGASFILAKLDNNDNVYYDIDGYIDENYFIYNKAQYESLFPNVPYIKIEFNKHASETPILIRLINRIQTQDINNPQYIKLKTSSDAIVKEDNIVLITLNDLINDLIEENNI